MLWILILGIIAPTTIGQPHLEYLSGIERLQTSGYTDYYFSCDLTGDFLQWEYNNEPLRRFEIQDAGHVAVIPRPTYSYTATLLSSQLDPETNQRILDSVLVLSFTGDHPSSFEVTCSSNSDFNTTWVDGMHGNVMSNSSSDGQLALDYITSTKIAHNKNRTHVVMCGVQNDQQFYEIHGGQPIGFNKHDDVGQARTHLSQDENLVITLGVFVAQLPYQTTSILFITENSDITVMCYSGTNQVILNSNQVATVETDSIPPSVQTAVPIIIKTTNSSEPPATTVLSSTIYETDDLAKTVGIIIGSIILFIIILLIAVAFCTMKWKNSTCCHQLQWTYKPNQATAEGTVSNKGPSESIHGETWALCKDLENTPTEDTLKETPKDNASHDSANSCSDGTLDKDTSRQTLALDMCHVEDSPMEVGLTIGGNESEYESASSNRYNSETIQNSMEESSTGDASDRVCESSTHLFGHEYNGIECVKSFESLQEASANGLGQSYWNASVSGSLDVAQCEESPNKAIIAAAGNTFKIFGQNINNNLNVTEECVYIADDLHNNVDTTVESKDELNDVSIMDEDNAHDNLHMMEKNRDAFDDVHIMEEDKDTLDDVPVTEENMDTCDNVPVTKKDKDLHYNAHVTEEGKTPLGNVVIMEEHKCAKSNKRATAEENGTECDSYYCIHLQISQYIKELVYQLRKVNSFIDQWFWLISIIEAKLKICNSITEIFQYVLLVFRMVQIPHIMLYFQGVLFFARKSEISGEPLDGGGTLHVPKSPCGVAGFK